MKLKVDAIQAKYLPLTMKGSKTSQPVLKIVAGDFEATTSRVEKAGDEFHFPEAFQIDIDEDEYNGGKLLLEVEAYDFATGEYVYIGKGRGVLKKLIPDIDDNVYFIVDLAAYEKKLEGPRQCEIVMRGVVTNKDPLEEELLQKIDELATVKKSYDEYIKSSKELEEEMENALAMAQKKIEKLLQKNKASVEKYNELTITHTSTTEEITTLRLEIEQLRLESKSKGRVDEANAAFSQLNDELTNKLARSTAKNESLLKKLSEYEEERVTMSAEIDELYTSRYESELKQNEHINELNREIERLKGYAKDSEMLVEMAARMEEMAAELAELRANAGNSAITYKSTFISNTNISNTVTNTNFYETIVNSTNETNVFVTNIIKSGNIEKIKDALINQLRLYEELKVRNAKLLGKVQSLQGSIQVCARTRPPSDEEVSAGGKMCLDASDDAAMFVYDATTFEWSAFEFDSVWGYDHTQSDVFADVEPMISAVADGSNACIMSYGEASSGKSFTMNGFGEYLGISYRAILKLFEILELKKSQPEALSGGKSAPGTKKQESTFEFTVELSLMSLHQEELVDLMLGVEDVAASSGAAKGTSLQVSYNTSTEQVEVAGLQKVPVTGPSQAMQLFAQACAAASTEAGFPAKTHLILQLAVTVTKNQNSAPQHSTLSLLDLASANHKADIPSLEALNGVMTALAKKSKRIPFEASKLTTLLRPALSGGDAKTMMIFTMCPTDLTLPTTMSILNYAATIRSVKVETGGRKGSNPLELRNMESKVGALRHELSDAKRRSVLIEKKLTETKGAAQELISQLNEHNAIITAKYTDEKEQNKILVYDLELTQRNMKRTLDQLKEQISINERMVAILKIYEAEVAAPKSGAESVVA